MLTTQSAEIAAGVDGGTDTGAGDQGLMFGYATTETPEALPLPFALARRLTRALTVARRDGRLPWLRPDGKAQVTVEYPRPGEPGVVGTVVVSAQHAPDIALADVRRLLLEHIVEPTLEGTARKADLRVLLNPAGSFVLGGPAADCGVTGRKIIVDSYDGAARHGGGAFSGKDPTKVDRSAAYMARQLALRVVRAGLAARCELQVASAIGVSQPVSLFVDTFGTGVVADDAIAAALLRTADLTPRGIATTLDLWRPRYRATARAGHFGHPPESGGNAFTWERTSEADLAALRREVGR